MDSVLDQPYLPAACKEPKEQLRPVCQLPYLLCMCSMNSEWSRLLHGKQGVAMPKSYGCLCCQRRFAGALARHFTGYPLHKPRRTKSTPEQCKECKRTFKDQGTLARHIVEQHLAQPDAAAVQEPSEATEAQKGPDDPAPPGEQELFVATDAQKALRGVAAVGEFGVMQEAYPYLTQAAWCRATGTLARTFRRWKAKKRKLSESGTPVFKGTTKQLKTVARAWQKALKAKPGLRKTVWCRK